MKIRSFKELVKMVSQIESIDDIHEVEYEIKVSFENDKISWNDYEILYRIINFINV